MAGLHIWEDILLHVIILVDWDNHPAAQAKSAWQSGGRICASASAYERIDQFRIEAAPAATGRQRQLRLLRRRRQPRLLRRRRQPRLLRRRGQPRLLRRCRQPSRLLRRRRAGQPSLLGRRLLIELAALRPLLRQACRRRWHFSWWRRLRIELRHVQLLLSCGQLQLS